MTITETHLNAEEQQVADLVDALLTEFPPKQVDAVTFLGAQFDKGLAWVHFPVGHGGLGLNPQLQKLINETIYAQGAPNPMYRNPTA
ncbi:MAG TPA: acyl-CoA dehydrogenase, partial [Acidimicrobiaceae bacterium]|nr:acyl-CoA dehydrogenase [Acidimicrobiaceae bacterium]